MKWQQSIVRIFRTRYTRSLEAEISRLRAENRALVNSILSVAGLPPLRLEAEINREHHRDEIAAKFNPSAQPHPTNCGSPESTAPRAGIVLPANPHRRRSWQQINRILEIEEARQITNRDNSDAMHLNVHK